MFQVGGVQSYVREEGAGPTVLCMHGVPSSSFLYRKVLRALAAHDVRGVALDLPGSVFAQHPAQFDSSFTGLGRFAVAAVDALDLISATQSDSSSPRIPDRIES